MLDVLWPPCAPALKMCIIPYTHFKLPIIYHHLLQYFIHVGVSFCVQKVKYFKT